MNKKKSFAYTLALVFLAFKDIYIQPGVRMITCILAESVAEYDDLIQYSPFFILNLMYRIRVEKSKLRKTLFCYGFLA